MVSEGLLQIGGHDLQRTPEARAAIGLISHQTLLYDELTARENLDFFARLYRLTNQQQLETALVEVGLLERQNQRVGSFSRGMKQRLALARATLHDPSILLLDEPFTGLDTNASAILHHLFLSFLQKGGTFVLATHRLDAADGLVDRLLVLERGYLRLDQALAGNLDELRARCAPYLDAVP